MKKWIKPLVALLVVGGLIVFARSFELGRFLDDMNGWVVSLGFWGPVVFIGIYAVYTTLALPGSALTIAAGALFGSVLGVVTVIFGATLGASFCFLIARYGARGTIESMLSKNEKFQKLDRLTEKNGAAIVAVTRLVPLFPFNLLNYGFGLTRVSFLTYVFWSFVCMLPGTILFVVGTDAVATTIREGRIPWVLIAIILLCVVVLAVIVKKARFRLNQ